jgi:hypothetical protein
MHEGLIIKGNVFINRHADPKRGAMGLGLDPCYNTRLPCDKATVRTTNTRGQNLKGYTLMPGSV